MMAAATEALGRMAGKLEDAEVRRRVIDRVEQSLEAEQMDVRKAAARGLRWIGGERSRAILERIAADDDTNEALREVAIIQLGELGDAAAEATLAKALDRWNDSVRKEARKALEKLFPSDRTRVEFLAVGSEYDDIAEPAASYLATEANPADLLPRLAALKDEALRFRLKMGLLKRPSLPAADLARLLESEAATARDDAAWLIAGRTGSAGEAAAASAGAEAAASPAASPVASPSASTLSEADRATFAAALVAAERRTAEQWARAFDDARDEEASAWLSILWAVRRVRAEAAGPALRSVVRADERTAPPEVRREAARALADISSPSQSSLDTAALKAALKDMDADVRGAAASSLAALSPDSAAVDASKLEPFDPVAFGVTARAAIASTRAGLLETSQGRRMALPAVLVNGEIEPLLGLAKSAPDEASRLDAIAALGHMGGDAAVALLGSLAFDKKATDIAVRKAAYRALRRAKRKAAKIAKENGAHA
jgi:ParB family chromosome partitioning protein